MKKDRFKIVPASYLILRHADQVLLLRRFNTGYHDGSYSLVAGHLDGNETFTAAMIREAQEEAGIMLKPENLKVVHAMHRYAAPNAPDMYERIDVFFRADVWEGEVKNNEPHKCDNLSWFALDSLPENTIPFIRQALEHVQNGVGYSEFGWEDAPLSFS